MEFEKFVEWALMALLGGAVTWCVKILNDISESISHLNVQIGTILEKTAWHEKEIERHDNRLNRLERHEKEIERHDNRLNRLERKD